MILYWCVFFIRIALTLSPLSHTRYLSKPDLLVPVLDVSFNKLDEARREFIFLSALNSCNDGLLIYDTKGDLVWSSNDFIKRPPGSSTEIFDLRPVEAGGQHYLTFTLELYDRVLNPICTDDDTDNAPRNQYAPRNQHDAELLPGAANYILNDNYTVAQVIKSEEFQVDCHEFTLIANGTAYVRTLIQFVPDVEGRPPFVDDIVEIRDWVTGDLMFQWHSLEHIDPAESCFLTNDGDFSHINSFDIDIDGNFIFNAFHTCTTFKVNSSDGSIIWRLGGSKSDFTMLDGYPLKFKHYVRVRKLDEVVLPPSIQQDRQEMSDKTHLVLSMFDNGLNQEGEATAPEASGVVVLLDLLQMTAQVIERYPHPDKRHTPIFGSFEFLDNGNRFVGWALDLTVSEFSPQGELLFHALQPGMPLTLSYRSYKRPWVGHPLAPPDVFSYSWTCGSPSVVYVSWNGATEVASWNVLVGDTDSAIEFYSLASTTGKEGFETVITLPTFSPYVIVEAIDKDGHTLGRSEPARTFVPASKHTSRCDLFRCPVTVPMTEDNDISRSCKASSSPPVGSGQQSPLLQQGRSY